MVAIIYYDPEGQKHEIKARAGDSLMEIAVTAGVPGVDAICGGSCVCGTCQVWVDEAWFDKLGPRGAAETELIEASKHPRPTSRLGCQIRVSDVHDGIVLRVPPEQG